MNYVLLVVGFVLLVKGADFFVDGAGALARILKVPTLIIGLTIVSIGTSLPEAAVSITAGFSGSSDISLGNIIGSNIFNLLVVVGISGLFGAMAIEKNILHRDLWVSIGAELILLTAIFLGEVSRIFGVILFAIFIVYLVILIRSAMKNRSCEPEEPEKKVSLPKSIIFIIIGAAAVIFGGDMVVDSASAIAKSFGMSETLVGLTIVAMGTSLPELVTSVIAAKKHENDLAIGNVIGSNIFNILFIGGFSAILTPITADPALWVDLVLLIVASLAVFLFSFKKHRFGRVPSAIFLATYVCYMAWIIIR